MGASRLLAVLGLVFAAGCANRDGFVCFSNDNCGEGICQPSGHCSFDDASCPSGQRYGEEADERFAGRCVPEVDETSSSGGPPVSGSSSTAVGTSSDGDAPSNSGTTTLADDGSTTAADLCGNGIIDPGESCDFGVLGEATCESIGLDGGVLACAGDCTFDTTGCASCGNGRLDPGEACDGPLMGVGCSELGFGAAAGASIACNATCDDLDVQGCGAALCDEDPTVQWTGCPETCGGCPDEACAIVCSSKGECAEQTIACPAGRTCNVWCEGVGACTNTRVEASNLDRVEVLCTGDAACEGLTLDCTERFGQCFINCDAAPEGSCADAQVHCGHDECSIKCTDPLQVPGADVDCGSSCYCELCGQPA